MGLPYMTIMETVEDFLLHKKITIRATLSILFSRSLLTICGAANTSRNLDMLLFAALVILAVCLVAGFAPKHGMQTIIYLGWAILAASVLLTAIRYLVF